MLLHNRPVSCGSLLLNAAQVIKGAKVNKKLLSEHSMIAMFHVKFSGMLVSGGWQTKYSPGPGL